MPRDGLSFAADHPLRRLEREMDDLVEKLLRRPIPAAYRRAWAPRLDVYETQDDFVVVVELAGVEPQGVTIEIEGEQVTITGSRGPTVCPEGAETLQLEIPFGDFERRLILPTPVDATGSSADFTDGILTVHLPKAPRRPTRVQVDVQPEP